MPKTPKKEKEMHNKNGNVECEDPAKTGKGHLILKELEANDVDIVGLSEIRCQGERHFQYGDSTVIFVEEYADKAVLR